MFEEYNCQLSKDITNLPLEAASCSMEAQSFPQFGFFWIVMRILGSKKNGRFPAIIYLSVKQPAGQNGLSWQFSPPLLSFPISPCLHLSYIERFGIILESVWLMKLTLSLSLRDRVDRPVAGAGADGGQTPSVHQTEGNSTGNILQ